MGFEEDWWGNCTNTYGEETKQLVYARYMGLDCRDRGGPGPTIDLEGKSVLDIGGGPCSLLLKTINGGARVVVDPFPLGGWILLRYEAAEIDYVEQDGESFDREWTGGKFDECWIYNVLQHVESPSDVIASACTLSKYLRIFEWLDLPPYEGHPHELREEELREWLSGCVGIVKTVQVNEGGATGKAFVATLSTAI